MTLHLRGRLFAGDVQAPRAVAGERGGGLQQERGLADAGFAPDQRDRPGDEPTAEHPVELGDARRPRMPLPRIDLSDRHGWRAAGWRRGARRLDLFDQRVPGAAGRAAARPLRGPRAALGAAVRAALSTHERTVRGGWDIPVDSPVRCGSAGRGLDHEDGVTRSASRGSVSAARVPACGRAPSTGHPARSGPRGCPAGRCGLRRAPGSRRRS